MRKLEGIEEKRTERPDSRYGLAGWWPVLVFAALAACNSGSAVTGRLAELGGQPCQDSDFICVALAMPLDHFNADDDRTIDVRFAVSQSSSDTDQALVIAVGGPGSSGLEEAGTRFDELEPDALADLDLVFFDQRGIGMFDEGCPDADDRIDRASTGQWDGEDLTLFSDTLGWYTTLCLEEMGRPQEIVYLTTEQTAEDLEAFRQAMGYEELIIYGESYGTSLAQVYAGRHPDSVERLVFDGTMDRTRDGLQMADDRSEAIENTLDETLAACSFDSACVADLGTDPSSVFEQLMDELAEGDVSVRFPVEPDYWEHWTITVDDVADVAFDAAYTEAGRSDFLRALAAYDRDGDLVPMMRLVVEPAFELGKDGSFIAFNSVYCSDLALPGDDLEAELKAIEEAADAASPLHRHHYWMPVACLTWPGVDHGREPDQPFTGNGIPTLVVASDLDAATPYSHSLSVLEHLDSGQLLTVHGGSHVMYGRGNQCVDDAVTAFIVDGTWPAVTSCQDAYVTYRPLLPQNPHGADRTDLLEAIDDEIFSLPAVWGLGPDTNAIVGCTEGGSATMHGTDRGAEFSMEECKLTRTLTVTGTGWWDADERSSRLEVRIHGDDCIYRFDKKWEEGEGVITQSC